MSTQKIASEHETEMLFLAKKLDGDPMFDRGLWLRIVARLCSSSNRAIARAAGRMFFAADRWRPS